MSNSSPELLWLLVKGNNSFIVNRKGHKFSAEAGNLRNRHCFKQSGLVQRKVVDVTGTDKGVEISIKSTKGSRIGRPNRVNNRTQLSGNFRSVAKTIAHETEGTGYRADLKADALARWSKIYKSQNRTTSE